MKYFRDPRVLAWTLICVALFAVLVAAWRIGQSRPGTVPHRIPDRTSAVADIDALRGRLIQLPTVSAAPATRLPAWAVETARLADQAADRRKMQGAGSSDGLVVALRVMASDATKLSEVDTSDPMAVRTAAAAVYTDADALTLIVGGARPDGLIPPAATTGPTPSTERQPAVPTGVTTP